MDLKRNKSLSLFSAPAESRSNLRQALPQILAVCVKNVLLLGFGMTLGFPTILIPSLSNSDPNEPFHLGQEAISWIGSINLICVPVGCLLSGAITQPIGRKRAMQFVNIPFLAAWLLFHFSTEVWQIYLALCITGLTGGLLEAPVLTYVAEITQPSLRGILSSITSVAVISGVLIQFLLGTFLHWKTVALFSCVVPVASFALLFFVPETPHWLIMKNRHLDARTSLAWLRGWLPLDEIEGEFKELVEQITKSANDNPHKNWRLYMQKSFLWPFSIVSLTFFLGHFSGMTTLQTYAVKIFSRFQAPIDKYYATITLGIVEVCGCLFSSFLVHSVGKRILTFFSLFGCGINFLIVAIYAYSNQVYHLEPILDNDQRLPNTWIPTTFLILAAFFTHTGIRVLPWMLIGEVYSNETRATGSGISGGVSYIFGFASNKIFLQMISLLTLPYTFAFYSVICIVGFVITYFVLPETEGKTLFEIVDHFAGKVRMDNSVHNAKYRRKMRKLMDAGVVNTNFEDEDSRL